MQIVLQISGCMVLGNDIKISTSRGAYFQKIGNIRGYEKTTPIVYTFNVPQIIRARIKGSDRKIIHISAEHSIELQTQSRIQCKNLRNAIVDELSLIASKRQERGIQWLGDFSNWCCNVLLREGQQFTDRENSLKEGYDRLSSSIIENHAALLNVTSEIQIFFRRRI